MKNLFEQDGGSVAVNLTPMIDIVFILLIFFAAISSHSNAEFENLTLPESETGGELDKEMLSTYIFTIDDKTDQIKLAGRPMNDEQIVARLSRAVQHNRKTVVVIRNRWDAPCGATGGRLLKLCARIGVENVEVAVKKSEE